MNPKPGQPGRKRKPAVVIREVSVAGISDCPSEPPANLPATGQEEWRRLVPHFKALGLCNIDVSMLWSYCRSYANALAAEANLDKLGVRFYKTKTGFIREMPEVAISQRERSLMNLSAQQLGFTPASRKKIGQEPQGNDQEDAEMRALFGEDKAPTRRGR